MKIIDAENGMRAIFYGGKQPLYFFDGTSDAGIVQSVLIDRTEYDFPRPDESGAPEVILDIGANIGVATVLLAITYPNAQIHAFEPMERNWELLKKNTAEYPNIICHQVALGEQDDTGRTMFHSDHDNNLGGYSFHTRGSNTNVQYKVVCKAASEYLRSNDIHKVDLIKIDTEGAEEEILCNLLAHGFRPAWILGELHGTGTFKLCNQLEGWGYIVAVQKFLNDVVYPFLACYNSQLNAISKEGII